MHKTRLRNISVVLFVGAVFAGWLVWASGADERARRADARVRIAAAEAAVLDRLKGSSDIHIDRVRIDGEEVCGQFTATLPSGKKTGLSHFRYRSGKAELRSDYENGPIEAFDAWDKALTYCIIRGTALEDIGK